jgi:hypothetical protein
VDAWPQVRKLGFRTVWYECKDCSIAKYGRDRWEKEGVAVWVLAKVPTWEEELEERELKKVRRQTRQTRKPKRATKSVFVPVRKDGLW